MCQKKSPAKLPPNYPQNFLKKSADCKRGRRKGATSKNVKNRQKLSKSFSTLFDNFRAGQKTPKIVKKCQKVFRHFSTIFARHLFSGPFCNPLKKSKITHPPPCPSAPDHTCPAKLPTKLPQKIKNHPPPPPAPGHTSDVGTCTEKLGSPEIKKNHGRSSPLYSLHHLPFVAK